MDEGDSPFKGVLEVILFLVHAGTKEMVGVEGIYLLRRQREELLDYENLAGVISIGRVTISV